jgi:epothilone polyketide synthase D
MIDAPDTLSTSQRLLLALKEARTKLEAHERLRSEPIAVIGMDCRFPGGADGPEAFWQLLQDGVDAIEEVPRQRWNIDAYYDPEPETPGKMNTRYGGFLRDIDTFDPQFFGLSPRETFSLDPQQRLLLEVSWRALENAGCPPERLAGSWTGVFVGMTTNDYARLLLRDNDLAQINSYFATGNSFNAAAGRLAYVFGLQGPCMAIDTACSSSLVAVHLAVQSLRSGESDVALAGGVSLILSPETTISLAQGRMLAPDGRCKAFDASANGFVRSEGCGVVVLKRLTDAQRDRDQVLAVILGSAVNQDGASSGFTVPNGQSQQALIRCALRNARLQPADVQYVETHGTGTSLGDPIEIGALGTVMGEGRPTAQPLLVGSVKSNIGHMEPAAGIGGLIKVILALQHGQIPAHLHFKKPNPFIPWDQLPVKVVGQLTPWPAAAARRVAAVSSFSFSGTNAQVVVAQPSLPPERPGERERPRHILTLSAKTPAALRELARQYRDHLARHPEDAAPDLGFSANTGRSHFNHRLCLVGENAGQWHDGLAAFAENRGYSGLQTGQVDGRNAPGVVFLFTGQGSQRVSMGRELYDTQPTFRQALQRCDEILRGYQEKPLLDVLYPATGVDSVLDETFYTQPALFALEYALSEMWRSWGIEPEVVVGHSMGEYVAACVAGVFSLEDGLWLLAERGRLMQTRAPAGTMATLFTDQARVSAALAPHAGKVSLAAINGPEITVISGAVEAVEAVVTDLAAEGVRSLPLNISRAFHSPLTEPIMAAFRQVLMEVRFSPPRLTLISNVTGRPVGAEVGRPDYWCRHLAQPVQFVESMQHLHRSGYELFVEIGPEPELLGLDQCLPEGIGADLTTLVEWLPSLRSGQGDWQQVLDSLSRLYVRGCPVSWAGFDRDYVRRRLTLPGHPFERRRYWPTTPAAGHAPVTPLVAKLRDGDGQALVEELAGEASLSAEEARLLPRLCELLVRRYQQEESVTAVRDWFYRIQWQLVPPLAAEPPGTAAGKRWLIFSDRSGTGEGLTSLLRRRGIACLQVFAGKGFETRADGDCVLDPAAPGDFDLLRQALAGSQAPPLGPVVHLWGMDTPCSEDLSAELLDASFGLTCGSTLHLIQMLVRSQEGPPPQLWLVTRGAVQTAAQPVVVAVAQAPLWGLGKVIALEHPDFWGGLIDLAPTRAEDDAEWLCREILATGETEICRRQGQRYAARLVPGSPPRSAPPKLAAEATYLITGGFGSLGLRLARCLHELGARHLILTGRRPPTAEAEALVARLREQGTEILAARVDVTDEAAITDLLAEARATLPPLRGVVHAAGVLADGILLRQDWQQFRAVMAPKVRGTWILHQLTGDLALDFFVTFSSVASLLGSPGQGNYAAANAFMDAWAHYRHSLGLPGLSLNWGSWAQTGMAARLEQRLQKRMQNQGFSAIAPEQGLRLFAQLLTHRAPQLGVFPVDWSAFREQLPEVGRMQFFAELVPSAVVPAATGSPAAEPLPIGRRLAESAAADRRDLLVGFIQGEVARVLGFEPSYRPDPGQGFFAMGMDSLMAINLKRRLDTALGSVLPVTLPFEYPSINALADYLAAEVLKLDHMLPPATAASQTARPAVASAALSEPIAIIGMGCRFPGAEGSEGFWHLLREGVDAIGEVPPDRWDLAAFYDPDPTTPGKMATRYGGFVDQVDRFDAHFFGIAPREAANLDPQQRFLLEVSWEALEDAGQTQERLHGSLTGVFVGLTTNDYVNRILRSNDPSRLDPYYATGNAFNASAGRLSFVLGLQGPSMAIDTACSSSLVAVHMACQSLRLGECHLALAGGASLMLSPETTISLSQARMLAPDGRCKTFDAAANGYVRGEGCGMVVLKRLSDAQVDGDRIRAVILGSAVNQDGPSSGLTVPNGMAQCALIRQALQNAANLAPGAVDYLEAHGTGTALGDPIEMKALGAVFGKDRPDGQPLLVGSVKTNVGHLEPAAGIAGLIKCVLALEKGQIPPHLHVNSPSPHIPWEELPLAVPTQLTPWPVTHQRRIAGVSSFGFSGTNAHAVLAEPPPCEARETVMERPRHLLTLSAKSETALQALAGRYADHLRRHPETRLADLCYSANTGRSRFAHRLALPARETAALSQVLAAIAQGESVDEAFRGQVSAGGRTPKVAFLFTGQGAQYAGMGRELYATQPVFRSSLDRCAELVTPLLERPLLDVLYEPSETGDLDQTVYTQTALFALEYALAQVWQAWGVRPALVMGHSVGEYVAACLAGVFSLEEGLRLIAARGRLMQALPGGGGMAVVRASEERAAAAIAPHRDVVGIAAINGPDNVVLSGAGAAVDQVAAALESEGIKVTRLKVSHAFHSPLMAPILEQFGREAAAIPLKAPQLRVISNLTGGLAAAEMSRPDYWVEHIRRPVRFAEGMTTLLAQEVDIILEVGPKPVLLGMGLDCQLPATTGRPRHWLPSLRPGRSDWEEMLASLAHIWVRGLDVNWHGFDAGYGRQRIALPTYPWQRQRYWVELPSASPADPQAAARIPWGDCLYQLGWEAQPRQPDREPADKLTGTWLILADRGGLADDLARLLTARGAVCRLIHAAPRQGAITETIGPAAAGQKLVQLLQEVESEALQGVVHMWSLDTAPADALTLAELTAAQDTGVTALLHLVQALTRNHPALKPALWVVSRGAQPVGEESEFKGLAHATLWGMGKTIALEHSEIWGGLLDLAPNPADDEAAAILAELIDSQGEDQIAWRQGVRHVARLRPLADGVVAKVPIEAAGSYLITGGLGGLGLRVARWLVESGAKHLWLIGRRPPSAEALRLLRHLEEIGAEVKPVAADVTSQEAMAVVLAEINSSGRPLRGVVHAAGLGGQRSLVDLDAASLHEVLAPKVQGAFILHELTAALPLDFFICFSSIAGVWGSAGQAHYAAANHFLDVLAHYRHRRQLAGLSVAWGPWAEIGMASTEALTLLERIGIHSLRPDEAVDILARLAGSSLAQVCVARVQWESFRGVFEARKPRPLLARLPLAGQAAEPTATAASLRQLLEAAPAEERPHLLIAGIQEEVARVLRLADPRQVDPAQGFFDLGMDSLMAVELRKRLEASLRESLPSTLIFDHPTPKDLAAWLGREILAWESVPAAEHAAEAPHLSAALVERITHLDDEEVSASITEKLAKLETLLGAK